jgi:hypothetical protein
MQSYRVELNVQAKSKKTKAKLGEFNYGRRLFRLE